MASSFISSSQCRLIQFFHDERQKRAWIGARSSTAMAAVFSSAIGGSFLTDRILEGLSNFSLTCV
jgi:hypothetical protein